MQRGVKRQRGMEKRRNKWVWGFPSLWWIDRAYRGSQKEKYKNRRACLPWHRSSLPMYQMESLLFHFLLPPMAQSFLLSTSNSFQDNISLYLSSLLPVLRLCTHPPTPSSDKSTNFYIPLGFHFITVNSRCFIYFFHFFLSRSQKTH